MKKWIIFLLLFFAFSSSIQADTESPNAKGLQKEILHDALIHELLPSISQVLDKQFGVGHGLGIQCQKILEIKRLEQGQFYFEVTLEAMTFKGAHNPPNDIVTVKISNYPTGNWVIKEYSINEDKPANYVCGNPDYRR
ncbi:MULTISPECIES: DUF3888 domain-containing protein [unclassified Paenibacillus]|uniref:DUF3888 domain-containing protein n=1 Tax=unclassified Paenibacillus TaxID=185978 RepID=UPI002781F84D|nr:MULTISPECIES: DUF3888 domain-containing protein [unclassified Paenibacillus]MDQ0896432.1 hypothetical protein [Paenibacillus sp. V4I7]MDQ0914024.1 hypothetical protein [Paenibacillus sp. V4I5]